MSRETPAHKLLTMIYQVRIKGPVDFQWADWFAGMTVSATEDGDTLITGPVEDQAALHGLLKKLRDRGLTLLSINGVDDEGGRA
jgi:hypothetical protein